MIKRFKILYILYNFFHKKELSHNIPVYRKFGLNKSYFSSVSSKTFANIKDSRTNTENFIKPTNTVLYKCSDKETKNNILNFEKEGFIVLKNYLPNDQVDAINNEITSLLKLKKIKFKFRNKLMFAIHKSYLLRSIGNNPALLELLSSLLKGEAVLFQSINFLRGSEQKTHSDSIHMTTFPLGGLLGVWIALEDMTGENGPLHYFPGSHKLPYYLNSDYNNEGNSFLIGDKDYTEYEKMLAEKINKQNLQKKIFLAKKGDLLIWHANLLHGGEPHINKNKTRKSMVLHYYKKDSICYHEITQRPALIKNYS